MSTVSRECGGCGGRGGQNRETCDANIIESLCVFLLISFVTLFVSRPTQLWVPLHNAHYYLQHISCPFHDRRIDTTKCIEKCSAHPEKGATERESPRLTDQMKSHSRGCGYMKTWIRRPARRELASGASIPRGKPHSGAVFRCTTFRLLPGQKTAFSSRSGVCLDFSIFILIPRTY